MALVAAAVAAASVLVAQRWQESLRAPTLHHADTAEARDMVAACSEQLLAVHRPHALLELAGSLSSSAMLLRPPPLVHGARESQLFELADGGTARLDWQHPTGGAKHARGCVLLLPGLNNSSSSSYVQHTMAHLCRAGLSAVCIDYRGVGGLPLSSSRVGCADAWRDLPFAVDAIRALLEGVGNGNVPLAAIGFSMGGAVLTKFLAVTGEKTPFCAAVTVSSPFALSAAMRTLEASVHARIANFGLTQLAKLNFLGHIGSHRAHLHGIDWRGFLLSASLRQLEESVICKLHGYDTAEHYYEANRPDFLKVRTPLLCVHAEDDPVIAIGDVPVANMIANPRVVLAVTRRGGHLGWTGGTFKSPWAPTWAELLVVRFVISQIESGKSTGESGKSLRESGVSPGQDKRELAHEPKRLADEAARNRSAWGPMSRL
mmetsp:Transcript_3466/g.8664  ORF Transcript_3466/g.8664 Transcript_3466/m.8664 type:complete len:431 (+) Transcript_3466:81-1373(+)